MRLIRTVVHLGTGLCALLSLLVGCNRDCRTVADLEGSRSLDSAAIAEAIQYRALDRSHKGDG